MFQTTKNSNSKTLPKWIQFRSVGYLTGRGIHYGSADGKIYPRRANAPNKFSIGVDPRNGDDVDIVGMDFSGLEDKFYDWVFLGPQFSVHPNKESLLKQSLKKLKPQGHLIVCVPRTENYFKYFQDRSWLKKDSETDRDGFHWIATKRYSGSKGLHNSPNCRTCSSNKSACVVRYGAFGDQVVISPLVKKLKEDGYHVTINSHTDTGIVLCNNPNVDNIVGQERDAIFNPDLREYWEEWEHRYDRYINLSESVEASLLKTEGFRDYYTPKQFRQNLCDVNYYDRTMAIGGYPDQTGTRPELYFTEKEHKRTTKLITEIKKKGASKVILWLLKGSSHHKRYPMAQMVVNTLLRDHPDWVIIQTGGPDALPYRFGHDSGRVIDLTANLPIRDMMCMTQYVDLVIGPETGLMNAAAAFDVPKIVMLSHSTIENLTKYWTNTISLEPPKEYTPCYPCHQLHYTLESCPLAEIKKDGQVFSKETLCSVTISPETIVDTIYSVLT